MPRIAFPSWSQIPVATLRWMAVVAIFALCFAALWVNRRIQLGHHLAALQARADMPVHMAFAELTALDRDVQKRFGVVPDHGFGMGRIGVLHELYVPLTTEEKATVAGLQKKKLELTFYVMSRRTWKHDPSNLGQMPLQGPLYMTPPPPTFRGRVVEEQWPKTHWPQKGPDIEGPMYKKADGRYAWPPPVPDGLPNPLELEQLAVSVFKTEATNSKLIPVGASKQLGKGDWQVAAVPVRASNQACADCHNMYFPRGEHMVLNDVVGVALYAYRPARPNAALAKKLAEYARLNKLQMTR